MNNILYQRANNRERIDTNVRIEPLILRTHCGLDQSRTHFLYPAVETPRLLLIQIAIKQITVPVPQLRRNVGYPIILLVQRPRQTDNTNKN
jgi:hypothetical protein